MQDLTDAEIDSICAGLVQNAAKVRYLRRMGLLECTHFMVTVKAREAIAKASPLGPLGDAAMKGNGK